MPSLNSTAGVLPRSPATSPRSWIWGNRPSWAKCPWPPASGGDKRGNGAPGQRWQEGALVAAPDADAEVRVRIRTGSTDDPRRFFTYNDQGELDEVDFATWQTLKERQGPYDPVFVGWQGPLGHRPRAVDSVVESGPCAGRATQPRPWPLLSGASRNDIAPANRCGAARFAAHRTAAPAGARPRRRGRRSR